MTDTTTTESTATNQLATTDEPTLETVCEQLDQLTERVEELEAAVEQKMNTSTSSKALSSAKSHCSKRSGGRPAVPVQ